MSVKRQWKLHKVASFPIDEDTRQQLVTDIMRRKTPSIRLYAWDIHEGIATEAFFKQQSAIYDWYTKKRLWESAELPKGVLLYEWSASVDDVLHHSKNEKVTNVPVSQEREILVGISPSTLHEDMQRILKRTQ